MYRKIAIITPVIGIAMTTAPLMAQEGIKSLLPSNEWTVTRSADHCSMRRTFGTGKEAINMRVDIRQNFLAQNVQLTGALIPRLPKQSEIDVLIGESTSQPKAHFFLLKQRPNNGVRWMGSILLPDKVDKEQSLDVTINSKSQMRFALGTSREVVAEAAKCQNKLLEKWGVNVAQNQSISPPKPIKHPLTGISSKDFPLITRAGVQQELLTYRVNVDENGVAGPCTIVAASKLLEIDQAVCRFVDQNNQYSPATGADGQPVSAPYIQSVNWSVSRSGSNISFF